MSFQYFQYVLLGIIQGTTEFLPISSSAHLIIAQDFLTINGSTLLLDVALHVGTLFAVLFYMRRDLVKTVREVGRLPERLRLFGWRAARRRQPRMRVAALTLAAMAPTVVIALVFKDLFAGVFSNPRLAGMMLMVTGVVLWLTRRFHANNIGATTLTWRHAVLVGLAQGIAIMPGISRSGMTIAACLALGLRRPFAVQFAFLLAIPTILAAAVFEFSSATVSFSREYACGMALGMAAAAVVGWASLWALDRMVRKSYFHHFAWYCWAVGACVVWIF